MAHQSRLATWLLSQRAILKPAFTQYDWPARHFSGYFDFSTEIMLRNEKIVGRGIAKTEELALEKSVSEVIERLICRSLNLSSVGIAVGGRNGAAEHARNEVLERFFFDEHQRRSRRFFPVGLEGDPSALGRLAARRIADFDITHSTLSARLSFHQMASPAPYLGLVCGIWIGSVLSFIGLSLDTDAASAIERSLCEAMVNFARYVDIGDAFYQEVRANRDLWNADRQFLNGITHLVASDDARGADFKMPVVREQPITFSQIEELYECPIEPIRCIVETEPLKCR